ncbi:M23 family metallopeptidase [Cyanobium sp. Morenito 9A2]|uniref:M23 family metallopeptidase n=1 Tax=Cyanobium sp. Morenito 9A2 TaxID=2823718 RepID=UPI0037BEACA7
MPPARSAAALALLVTLSSLGGLPPAGTPLAWAQQEPAAALLAAPSTGDNSGPLLPPPSVTAPVPPLRPPLSGAVPAPLRPSVDEWQGAQAAPRRFDQSLDALVREGVVTPAERARLRMGSIQVPIDVPAHQQACRTGALSEQECRSGLAIRWRGRHGEGELAGSAGFERIGPDGVPLPPITVPVSALLAGSGGTYNLAQVFAVTPRPAPLVGNGNSRLLFPVIGSALTTSSFGWRLHPLIGSWLMHAGRDLAAPEGTPVVAALSGKVVSSGLAGGYGIAVELEHQRPTRRTLYGHLSEIYVKEGDLVRQGEVIGRVGSTGLSTGPHLHFELRLPQDGGWVAVDPGELDPGKGSAGGDAIALLMGQLLQTLERPKAAAPLSKTPDKAG